MPLRRIKQTSKLLLIEEFCTSESVPDLYTLLRNEDVTQKEEFFNLIEQKLEVSSYEEFVKKFMPSVWEWMEPSDDPIRKINFCYSLEKPMNIPQAHEMKLSSNEFYNMVMDLYTRKGTSGDSNLEFDYSKVAELLSPKKVMENAKQLRKDLYYNYNKMLELGEGSAKSERNKCIKKIKEIRKEIVSQYKDSFTGTIKLALADTESKLALLSEQQVKKDGVVVEEKSNLRLPPYKAQFDEKGDIELILIEDNQNQNENKKQASSVNQLAVWIGNDFDNSSTDNNSYIRSLVVSNYGGDATNIVEPNRDELIQKRNQYTAIYKASQEQFIRAISSAVEKILNVKVFFEHASNQGKQLPAPVIVTNCKAHKFIEDEVVKKNFSWFINETKYEIDDRRIWFALIPAIGDSDFVDEVDDGDIEDLDNLDFNDEDVEDNVIKTHDGDVLVSADALKSILEILKEGKITTFFNYRANENTGFARLNANILEKYRKKLESINGNPYAVFCYPNFTVLPKKETAIEIGKTNYNNYEMTEYIDIPGIYVDASYVAAGLVVGSQNPSYLEKKGYKVDLNMPCVRFDLEEGENRYIMLTKMNREGKSTWASEVEENIGADKFGFCFCSNTKYYKNESVKNTYVYVARNMHKDKAGNYDPIYTRLMMDFVMQYLQTETTSIGGGNKFKTSTINNFIGDTVGAWKREAEGLNMKANSLLRENEDVIFENDTLKMKFKNTEAEIELTIEKDQ